MIIRAAISYFARTVFSVLVISVVLLVFVVLLPFIFAYHAVCFVYDYSRLCWNYLRERARRYSDGD